MLNGFKLRVGQYAIRRSCKQQHCRRQFHNFNTAKSVGILYMYDALPETDLSGFIKFFTDRQIKVKTLGFTGKPEIPQSFLTTVNKRLFCREQLNWYKRPSSDVVDTFIAEPFDILIDFSREFVFPLHYIASLSHAAMRVGRFAYSNNPYEFILTMPKNVEDKEYIEQLKHYLQTIQTS